ncbi:MAG: enoyl-CoA hydratase-related protein [Myxococcota bacterium]
MTPPEGAPASFETDPSRWRHWRLAVRGRVARLTLAVDERGALMDGVLLKRNSYDLGVDVELRDAVERLRFEHPEVACVLVESASPDVFCAGANIAMLARASHALKVNFCKLTNETRFSIEAASAAGQRYIAVLAGTASGGGYELALACERILLVDDRRAAVSLPELPLLAVLPGTGGLTRLVDKRRVRPDRADLFCTLEEGVRAPRALEWGLVDAIARPSELVALVQREIDAALAAAPAERATLTGVPLEPLSPQESDAELRYRFLRVQLGAEARRAVLTVHPPRALADWLRFARELDDAILRLRFHHPELGLWILRCEGDAVDDAALLGADRLARETRALFGRVLKRIECSARSVFAVVDRGSCFHGALFELALAADRIYMLADGADAPAIRIGDANRGEFLRANGLSRLEQRFFGDGAALERALAQREALGGAEALELGLVTEAPDEIDWDEALRVALEERASFSPDALSGLEANLRFAGPETLETKVFARLSAWQNWIFLRPNASGPDGALAAYGRPVRAKFDWKRT